MLFGRRRSKTNKLLNYTFGIGLLVFIYPENIFNLNGYDNAYIIITLCGLKIIAGLTGIVYCLLSISSRRNSPINIAHHSAQGIVAFTLNIIMLFISISIALLLSSDIYDRHNIEYSDQDGLIFNMLGTKWQKQENNGSIILSRIGSPCLIQITKMNDVIGMEFDKISAYNMNKDFIFEYKVISKSDLIYESSYVEKSSNMKFKVNSKIIYNKKLNRAAEVIIRAGNNASSMLINRTIEKYNQETVDIIMRSMKY